MSVISGIIDGRGLTLYCAKWIVSMVNTDDLCWDNTFMYVTNRSASFAV